jgi:hypothetical protein
MKAIVDRLSVRPHEKSESRSKDASALANGEKSPEQLRLENAAFAFPNATMLPPRKKLR